MERIEHPTREAIANFNRPVLLERARELAERFAITAPEDVAQCLGISVETAQTLCTELSPTNL